MRERLTVLIINIAFAFRSGTDIVVDQIARGVSRGHRPIVFAPYVALHRNITDEASDVPELALSRHTAKLRAGKLRALDDLGRRLCNNALF